VEIRCSQCGASQVVAADVRLLQCEFCDTALVVDGRGTLFREVLRPTVDATDSAAHMRRFMAGTKTVAGLDRQARLHDPALAYFPFWGFQIVDGGRERVVLQPAAPSSIQGLQGMEVPAGDSVSWTPEATAGVPVVEPEIPIDTARTWLRERFGEVEERRAVLYHLPFYRQDYDYQGRTYHAAVDAVSGRVLTADYPEKAETPFLGVAALALAVFGIEGLLIGNPILKLFAYCISAPPLFVLAWWTSRKV
jgi:hypothetical protein